MLKKLLRNSRIRQGALLALLVIALVFTLGTLSHNAGKEARALKSPAALAFEKDPAPWLANPKDLSAFRLALRDSQLAQVGLVIGSPAALPGSALVLYTLRDGTQASAVVPGCSLASCSALELDALIDQGAREGFPVAKVSVDWRTPSQKALQALGDIARPFTLLFILLVALFVIFRLQGSMAGGQGKAGKLTERPELTFDDVVGASEAKAALQRVAAFLRDPGRYARLGARAPRGVLLVGPPGTGKTMLARALAGQCKANFIAVDGSYFSSMFYGAGVTKVRELFALARKSAPCVLFIDEVDGIGKRTTGQMSGGESELNRIINRVLVEMDGFTGADNVVVIAATNHAENIDPAMRRPGRFDMLVDVALPTLPERKALFELYLAKVTSDGSPDTAALARMSAGMSPADIANTVNKAAARAAEAQCEAVSAEHLLAAIETYQLGGEVSALKGLLTEPTRRRIAYHEAGHALVAHLLGTGSVDRVSIEPRGQALGVTYVSRETEDPLYGREELGSRLAMMLAGRQAEMQAFGNTSSGAADDLKRASALAVSMVGSLGFGRSLGPLSVAGVPPELLGPDIQARVLAEARELLEAAQAQCQTLLEGHWARIVALGELLLERENLSGALLADVLEGREPAPALTCAEEVRLPSAAPGRQGSTSALAPLEVPGALALGCEARKAPDQPGA